MNDNLLFAKIDDALNAISNISTSRFIGFLNEAESIVIINHLKGIRNINYKFWGGYKNAMRVILGIFPKNITPDSVSFPVVPLFLTLYCLDEEISHRDILGSIMALGIKREAIGDIIISQDKSILFVKSKIADFIKTELKKVKNSKVSFSDEPFTNFPLQQEFITIKSTVASQRLDCVISSITNKSRTKCISLIKSGSVVLNYNQIDLVNIKVKNKDKISVRGYGKFIIDKIDEPTRKGRIRLEARKYK